MARSRNIRARRSDAKDAEVGSRIRAQRLARAMSQSDLAARIGVSFQQVQKYENGANRVGASRLERIAEALNVSVSFFFDERMTGERSGDQPESMFGYVRSKRALRLLKAFDRVRDRKVRSSLILLAEHLASRP